MMHYLLLISCFVTSIIGDAFEPTNSVFLDRHKTVSFRWSYTDETITYEITVPGTGWVGIGFSPSGTMKGADIIFAWMVNEESRVLDMHSEINGIPALDVEQDIRRYNIMQNGTHTTLLMDRFLDTCDEAHDFVITEDTTRVIFAYGRDAPKGDLPNFGSYHGRNRGVRSLRLLDKKLPVLNVEDDTSLKYFDVRIKPFTIPRRDTYYHCTYHKLPEFEEKHHMIQFKVMITPGHEKYIHHLVVYHCKESLVTDQMLNSTEECYVNDQGDHWKYCTAVVVAWAVGMTELTLPDHVGFPVGSPGTPKIVKLEMHYDNVDLDEGVVDTTAVRILYTPNLREFDAGVLLTGHDVSPSLLVPPGSKDFVVHGHCTDQCLRGIMKHGNQTQVNVFGVFMHSHTAGHKMIVRHYRNGTELEPIAKDLAYDFDFQESKILPTEKTVRSGDNLIMECVYDTTKRTSITTSGLGTRDEMCFGFLMYYPKMDDAYCQAAPDGRDLENFFGENNMGDAYYAAMTKKWTDYSRRKFNEVQLASPLLELCLINDGSIEGLKEPYDVPKIQHRYAESIGRCELEKRRRGTNRGWRPS